MALFLIICGTYERNLYGFEVHRTRKDEAEAEGRKDKKNSKDVSGQEQEEKDEAVVELKPVFIYPSHSGCIKCLGVSGKFLASGSTDEVIKSVLLFALLATQ